MKKTKPGNNNRVKNDSLKSYIKLQLFSVLCYLIIFLIGSTAVLISDLPSDFDYVYSIIIFAVSSFIVGFYSGLTNRKNGLLNGFLAALPLNVIIVITSLFINKFSIDINILISSTVLILTSGVGGILAVNKRIKR